eukprot:m.36860 g.36860  ORF g.36860 m.36860 type:complete len:68 (+) comp11315_c0_seq1:229-432(+)
MRICGVAVIIRFMPTVREGRRSFASSSSLRSALPPQQAQTYRKPAWAEFSNMLEKRSKAPSPQLQRI